MIDLDHKAAMDRYLFAAHGRKKIELRNLQQVTTAILREQFSKPAQSPKQKKRRRRG